MKKILLTLIVMFTFIISGFSAWAQGASSASDEFTLEEITVTAEKREVNVQSLPSSVYAVTGVTLMEQGKITTEQILETVPNIKYEEGLESNSDGGIAIRGIKYKRTSDGQPPSATANYVDGIFQGIGGNYDIDRVEILRGPQGTLYGRSATGGVVAFYTNNPKLSEFSGSVSAEIGTADLKNVQAAVNVPVGDSFAVRAAGRYYARDGFFNPEGAYRESREGRVKLLFKPSEQLDIQLSASIADTIENSGGITSRLTSPTKINYNASETTVSAGGPIRSTQTSLDVNYDFGGSTLTYIGALRTYEDMKSPGFVMSPPGGTILVALRENPGENFHTHELRLASDSDGPLTWLIGTNYYKGDYERFERTEQIFCTIGVPGVEDPNPWEGALVFEQIVEGVVNNYGFFTEETFDLTDNMRLTGGLRYDKTTLDAYAGYNFNMNIDEYNNSLVPDDIVSFGLKDTAEWNNVTFKARLEYDLTPENMLYALIATGFQPGDIKLASIFTWGPGGIEDVTFVPLPFDEEKLTSYEVGSKNRFMDDRMQVNLSAFYYDYQAYQNFVDTALHGHMLSQAKVPTDMTMIGAELSADWLITADDRVSLTGGYLSAKIDKYPYIEGLGDTQQYMVLSEVTGIPKYTTTLSYEHNLNFFNGSTLVPRVEFCYTSGMYLSNMNYVQRDLGQLPYSWQDSYTITNLGATWTSPKEMFSITAYVRNALDKEYKAGVSLGKEDTTQNGVTPGAPRHWGLVLSTKF